LPFDLDANRLTARPTLGPNIRLRRGRSSEYRSSQVTHASLHPSSTTLPMDSRRGVVARIEPLAR
jgi:hypothetical protein